MTQKINGIRILLHSFWFLMIFQPGSANASHDSVAQPSSVHLKFENEDRLEIKMECGEQRKLKSIEIVFNGRIHSVSNEELVGVDKGARIGDTKVIVRHAGPHNENINKSLGRFVLLVPFGPITVNSDGGNEIHAFDHVAFDFEKGVLQLRRRAISLGDEKKQWILYQKIPGKKEVQDASVVTSAKNPFTCD